MAEPLRILVMPGLGADDDSTIAIRAALTNPRWRAHGWGLGRNEGLSHTGSQALLARLTDLFARSSRPVALVGWSMGGVYAHSLAAARPEMVRSVVTLGSPLRSGGGSRPRLPVPTTSVYSHNDVVVPWQASLVDESHPGHENVRAHSGHLTLGIDPAVLYLIRNRVGQSPERWEPFVPPIWLRAAFPRPRSSHGTDRSADVGVAGQS